LTIEDSERYSLLACAWIQSALGSPIVLNWQIPGVNVSGHSKRTVVQAMQFAFFAAGNVIGPHLFFPREAPRYKSAIKGLLICYCIAMFLQAVYMVVCVVQNRRRDAKGYHAQTTEEAREGFEDRTDRENKHFRVNFPPQLQNYIILTTNSSIAYESADGGRKG
jgi:Na+/melibiose symporter-like transporter